MQIRLVNGIIDEYLFPGLGITIILTILKDLSARPIKVMVRAHFAQHCRPGRPLTALSRTDCLPYPAKEAPQQVAHPGLAVRPSGHRGCRRRRSLWL